MILFPVKQPAQLQLSLLQQLSRFWSFLSLYLGRIYRVLITSIFYLLTPCSCKSTCHREPNVLPAEPAETGNSMYQPDAGPRRASYAQEEQGKGRLNSSPPSDCCFVWFPFIRMIPLHTGITGWLRRSCAPRNTCLWKRKPAPRAVAHHNN